MSKICVNINYCPFLWNVASPVAQYHIIVTLRYDVHHQGDLGPAGPTGRDGLPGVRG